MAKSTTTTKAKTKTTPTSRREAGQAKKKASAKPAVRAAKTTASKSKKKTVSKAPVKTVNVTKSVKTPKSSVGDSLAFLRRPQMIVAGLFGLLAIAAGMLMNTASAQIYLGHLSQDELASRASTVLVPAATAIMEVEFRWLLVGLLVTSAVLALLRATRYFALDTAASKTRVNPLRWVEFALTGAIAFEIAALLNGLQDAVAIKLSIISIVLAAFFAWMFERENAATGKPAKALYYASAAAVVFPVLALAGSMYGTYVYGMERSPWYAYAAAAIVAAWLLITVRSVWGNFLRRNGTHDAAIVSRNYNRLSVVSKVALAIALIVGLYAQ